MRQLSAVVGAMLLAGCRVEQSGEVEQTKGEAKPSVEFEQNDAGDGYYVTVESDTVLPGGRAEFVLSCQGGLVSFSLKVPVEVQPPPLRGNWAAAAFGFDVVQVDLGWLPPTTWIPRDEATAEAARVERIVRRFADAQEMQFTMPVGFGPEEPLLWSAEVRRPFKGRVMETCRL